MSSTDSGLDDTRGSWTFSADGDNTTFVFSSVTSVPDASLMYLLGPALIGLGIIGRRRKKA